MQCGFSVFTRSRSMERKIYLKFPLISAFRSQILKMKAFLFTIVSALCLLHVSSVKCPNDQRCQCYEETPGLHKIECSGTNDTMLEVTINQSENVIIECGAENHQSWSEFLHNSSLEIGEIRTLVFSFCRAPDWDGGHGERIAQLLGISELEVIKFRFLQSPLSSQELAPYPTLKRVLLSDNDVKNLSKEFLSCKFFLLIQFFHSKTLITEFYSQTPRTWNIWT